MRPIRLLPLLSAASAAALALACSSSPDGGAVMGSYQPAGSSSGGSSSGGSNAGTGSGSGSSSGGSSSGGSSSGASSSGASSSGGSSSGGSSSGSSSGSGSGGSSGGTTITADTTWTSGTTISVATTIAKGVTVTIANGATIHVASGVAITVDGTLTATTGTPHALMTGSGWTGIVVAAGGTLTADSLDLTGASMDVTGTATYSNGTITGAATPIHVETGGALTMTTVKITGTTAASSIAGNFTASHLDYDRGPGEGVTIANAASVVKIDNSTFHGADDVGGDMIVTNACASLTMTYTSIYGCHCAYHFNDIVSFDLENMDLHGDSYGFMMYGSNPTSGTRVFKNSNVETMAAYGIDELGTNGAISVSGVYFDTSAKIQLTDQEITVSNAAASPLPATSVGPQ